VTLKNNKKTFSTNFGKFTFCNSDFGKKCNTDLSLVEAEQHVEAHEPRRQQAVDGGPDQDPRRQAREGGAAPGDRRMRLSSFRSKKKVFKASILKEVSSKYGSAVK
jgi:hypothetical protein